MDLLFLGTGTSHGIPVIGCACAVCRSDDPRNRRLRPSVLVEVDGHTILIDTATDFRQQMLDNCVERIDAVLYTHAHADHIFGLDDIRRYNTIQEAVIPAYATAPTAAILRRTFAYIFCADPPHPPGMGWPVVDLTEIDGPFDLLGQRITPVPVKHGRWDIVGYRIGGLAYVTDVSAIPDASRPLLADLDVLVIDALRRRPHPTHFCLDQTLAEIARLRPRRAYLTHMCHDMEHAAVSADLPDGVALAYDGLRITV